MSDSDPLITIFTAPKPFTNPHIRLIQRNAIKSWQNLGEDVRVFLIGDEPGMAEFAAEIGISHMTWVACNPLGTPLVSSIFTIARQMSTSPLLAYVNADILLTPQFVEISRMVFSQVKKFLIVGQRYDLSMEKELEFGPGWDLYLLSDLQQRGRLHPPAGSDYFIFPRACFVNIPNFAVGRAGWDNWMLYHARMEHYPVVDATSSIIVIHQDHDYSHLPNGQPHYRLPETSENIRQAGGPRTIFTLADANYTVQDGQLWPMQRHLGKLLREIEIFPLTRLHSLSLADIFFTIMHPFKAWKEWRGRVAYQIKKKR
ncbi:MAG TPA: hypothetical protein VLD65_05555 [Anaerolineales bacterium]|nr:hypothetical protein [Anaerolineales bacterium]